MNPSRGGRLFDFRFFAAIKRNRKRLPVHLQQDRPLRVRNRANGLDRSRRRAAERHPDLAALTVMAPAAVLVLAVTIVMLKLQRRIRRDRR